jgi:D-sedoheptulose 7-phosphate isomerase
MSKIQIELQSQLKENIEVHKSILEMSSDIIEIIKNVTKKLKKGGKLLFCGNGGSAADAQHLSAEFLVRLNPDKDRRPLPVISLAMDTSTLTACGNDYGFQYIFSRNLQALAKKNDLLIAISTSGNSKNIIEVLKSSKKMKIFSITFLGCGGGKAKKLGNLNLLVPHFNVARIQESHIFLGHFIFNRVEEMLFLKKKDKSRKKYIQ